MRGELVIVRAHGGKPLVRRLWDIDEQAVYICNEENFGRLVEGLHGLWPVGFPRDDVFVYDPVLLAEVEEGVVAPTTWWSRLIPWQDMQRNDESYSSGVIQRFYARVMQQSHS
jgi:hypothetical protein